MCLDCFNARQLLSATFYGHEITPVKDFKVEDCEAVLKRQPFCSQKFHEREIARFFCLECQVCICQICVVTDHQSHKVVLLDKAALKEKDDVMCGAKLIRNKETELCEVIKQCEAEFAENLVQKSSSSDVMQNKEYLKQKFEELRGVEVPKHQQKTFVQFSVAPRLVNWKLGVIAVSWTADAKRSSFEGLDQRLIFCENGVFSCVF